MSCAPGDRRFRLLDGLVGWDAAEADGVAGLDDPAGLRLLPLGAAVLTEAALARWLPPPRLARGCDDCTWYLATPAPPASRLLRHDGCDAGWAPFVAVPLHDGRAVAAGPGHVAVADGGRVLVLALSDRRIVGEAAVAAPVALAFMAGTLLVAARDDRARDGRALRRLDLSGAALPTGLPPLPGPEHGALDRLAEGADCALWIVLRAADGRFSLWRAASSADRFEPRTLPDLAAAFPRSAPVQLGLRGFCLPAGQGCHGWQGRPMAEAEIRPLPDAPLFALRGQVLTAPINSGLRRCRWHRLRIDADVPAGTGLEVAVATSETPAPAAQGGAGDGDWAGYPTGVPHPADWQAVVVPEADVLIRQPPGRFLFVRLRLTGPGDATPVVRRLHLDLPRTTSAALLPGIYREDRDNPAAADFTERFVALFESGIETLDETIARYPALLDAEGVPPELLPWIGRFMGIAMDPGWTAAQRRALLRAGPGLFRRRGTPAALAEAVALLAGQPPAIEEPGLARPWGALGQARLGDVRLFGRAAARFLLGASALGQARLRSFGNPEADPQRAGAFRVTVALPALPAAVQRQVRRMVAAQVPAHVLADLRFAADEAFTLGAEFRLGTGTRLSGPRSLVLGQAGTRLGRGILCSTHAGRGC